MPLRTTPNALDGPRASPASGGPARQLIVFLHGYGADGDDVIGIGKALQQTLPDASLVAPHAPDFLPFMALSGRQWFPLEGRDPDEYRIGAEAAQSVIDQFLQQELASLGLGYDALVLAGFSQGAMMALQCGLRTNAAPAAILAFSGLLPGLNNLAGLQRQTPVLFVHGEEDDVVPSYHTEGAATALSRVGLSVETHFLDNLGHSIDERGVVHACSFLAQTLAS